MQYIVETKKTVDQIVADLEVAAAKYGFGVLHIHDLKQTMKNKGIEFQNECRILEICNPLKAESILTQDMNLNMALPCRISVYENKGKIQVGTILPTSLLGILSDDKNIQAIAQDVEEISIAIIDEVK